MALTVIGLVWAIFDDAFRLTHAWVEQKLFLAESVFLFFWELAKVCLLWDIYKLLFLLVRHSLLSTRLVSKVFSKRYMRGRMVVCAILFCSAVLMVCVRMAYLSDLVLYPPPTSLDAYNLQYNTIGSRISFDIIYLMAGLEVLVVCGVRLSNGRHKASSGSKVVSLNNILVLGFNAD